MARDYFFVFGSGNPSVNASLSPTFITFVNGSGATFTSPAITEQFPGSGLYHVTYGATQTMAFVMDGATSSLASGDRYISGVFDPYDQFGVTLNAAYAFGASGFALGNTAVAYAIQSFALGTTAVAGITLNFEQGSSNFALGSTNFALNTLTFAQGNTLFTLESAGNTLISAVGITAIAQGATIVAIGNTLSALGFSLGEIGLLIGSTASPIGTSSMDPVDVMGYLKRIREFNEGNAIYTKATGLMDFYSRGGATLLIEKTISDSSSSTTKT